MNYAAAASTNEPLDCYIVQNKNSDVLMASASGGAFSALANVIIKQGGVAYGAVYRCLEVVHEGRRNEIGLADFRGSKYAQSNMGDTYKKVENDLLAGLHVIFSGTPCQVQGLLAYLHARKLSESTMGQLYTVDFVCHGVATPLALSSYVSELKAEGFDVVTLNMRSKYLGYHCGSMELVSSDGRMRHTSTKIDPFLDAFYSNLILRPSCHSCAFKTIHRMSDITLYDSWSAEKIIGIPVNNRGYTNVLIQSEKGANLIEKARADLEIHRVPFEAIAPVGKNMITSSAIPNKLRASYMSVLSSAGIGAASKIFTPISLKDQSKEFLKTVLHATGLLDLAIRVKR